MGRLLKILLIVIAGVVGLVVVAAVSLVLFFDPNDFRERIQVAVKEQTGRDLTVGDLDVSVFPWLVVNVGSSQLGNPVGFRNDEMLSFDSASLSVRLLPLLIRQEIEVGTATLEGLEVNLEVDPNGRNNWDDLSEQDNSAGTDDSDAENDGPVGFDVANVALTDASIIYSDASTGAGYGITGLNFETGRIAAGNPIEMRGDFDFESRADDVRGHLSMRNTTTLSEDLSQITIGGLNLSGALEGLVSTPAEFNFDARTITIDTGAETINAGEMDLSIFGVSMAAVVEPFSYTGTPQPTAALRVATFSLKELMQTFDVEPPATVDPDAMQSVSFSANAAVGEDRIQLSAVSLEFDDSTMTGSISVPMSTSGRLGFDLEVDAVTLDGYMAPVDENAGASDAGAGDMDIPADLVRTLNVSGNFRIREAVLAGIRFVNMNVNVNAADGKLRLNPLGAEFYDGSYAGDVRIDASTDVPVITANERISGVNIGPMMKAMFDVDNVSGTINGQFQFEGAGTTMSAIQQDLDGMMSLELKDGALEGTDIWHQLRSARALYRREPAPEPTLPARTEFTTIRATGLVTDGIFTNDDFLAELPFLRLNGGGMVDLNTREMDYALEVRVLDRPEFMAGASDEELADFTETVVPLKITGPMSAPNIRPDIEGIFRARVEEAIEEQKDELRDKLLNRLLGGQEDTPAEGDPNAGSEDEEDPEEKLKRDLLKKLFEN